LPILDLGEFNDGNIAFEKINAQKINVDKNIIRYFYGNRLIRSAAQPIKKFFGIKSFGIGIAKQPLSESDRLRLVNLFRDDIKLLSELVSERLEHWLF
jgi:hypothetical protein